MRINQAVILAGGLGTRLRPISLKSPKPMALVNGKPFLEYIIKQIKYNGIENILILTGYKGEMIEKYFDNGSKIGINIKYIKSPKEWETGARIWDARKELDEKFFLFYSDNYANINLSKMETFHFKNNADITFLVKRKDNGNVKWEKNTCKVKYAKERGRNDFNYVELGYMAVSKKSLLKEMEEENELHGKSLTSFLEKVSLKGNVRGVELRDEYLSISDVNRLKITRQVMKSKKIILIDRDGTINIKPKKGEYITKWDEFKFDKNSIMGMKKLSRAGFRFIIISNQAGIARGMVKQENLDEIHRNMVNELSKEGISIEDIYISPDHWIEYSETRKPEPGLFFQAAKKYKLRLEHCLYIGDDTRDCEAAANAGCGMVYLTENREMPKLENLPRPYLPTTTIETSVNYIINKYKEWEV